MAIEQIYHLNRDGVSLVIETSKGTPNIVHWGLQMPEINNHTHVLAALDEPAPHGYFDEAHRGGVWRENARGFLGRPALLGHRNGTSHSQLFTLRDVEASQSKVTFISVDANAELEVQISYELTASGVVLVNHQVTNLGITEFTVDSTVAFMALPDHAAEVMDFTGRWLKERTAQRQQIQTGSWVREGREGRSGHDYTIIQLALSAGAGFQSGEAWGLSLAWSGNPRHVLERTMVGRTQIGAGELLLPGEVVLAQGETYVAPAVVATYSNDGIDGVSDRLHRWIRARQNHPTNRRPRPVSLNVWEAVYMNHDLNKLSELADVAAEVGVERMVLDDGWFGARRDDHAGLGDWVVSKDVWPNGLNPLIEKVKSKGLEFGLWFEGEMVNPDSDLFRDHPDWILHATGRTPIESRFQHVLDLTHEGAYQHVLGQVDAILSEYDIAYIKWDHNRVLTDAEHLGRAAVRNQTLAIYRLFDELKSRHPGLEIESCASGGGRIDLGMVEHADRFWTSDSNDALDRQQIQRYTTIAIPPEMLGTHIGPTHSHSTGRTASLAFRATTALFGHAGIEWDITETTSEERAQLRAWTDFYKANRGLLHSGRVIRVDQSTPDAHAHGVVAQDGSRALFAYVQLTQSQHNLPQTMRFAGLDDSANYFIKLIKPFGDYEAIQKRDPMWVEGATVSGAYLSKVGLRTPILKPEQALLIEVSRA